MQFRSIELISDHTEAKTIKGGPELLGGIAIDEEARRTATLTQQNS
jgi:hypothetical protein